MVKFLKEHWILTLAFFLLLFMEVPILYFGNLSGMLNVGRRAMGINQIHFYTSPTIGICLNNLIESRWMDEKTIWLAEAEKQGISVRIRVANSSLSRQISQIKSLLEQRVKVLILVPVSRNGLVEVLQEASQKRIKVILYDELASGPVNFYCGVDYQEVGRIQASYLMESAGPGNYLIIKGPADSYKAELIAKGQLEVLKKAAAKSAILINTEMLTSWSADKAVLKTRNVMNHQKIKAILAPNDMIAEELIKFYEKQRLPAPYVTGVGGEFELLQRVKTGAQVSTFSFNYEALAKVVFNYAVKLSNGVQVSLPQSITYQSQKIPSKLLPVYAHTHTTFEKRK